MQLLFRLWLTYSCNRHMLIIEDSELSIHLSKRVLRAYSECWALQLRCCWLECWWTWSILAAEVDVPSATPDLARQSSSSTHGRSLTRSPWTLAAGMERSLSETQHRQQPANSVITGIENLKKKHIVKCNMQSDCVLCACICTLSFNFIIYSILQCLQL